MTGEKRLESRRGRIAIVATLALALTAMAGLAPGADAKKKGGGKTFSESKQVNTLVPDGPISGPATVLSSQINVPKKFKGQQVGDVNVTLQATGASGATPIPDLLFKLVAPNGRTVTLFTEAGTTALGPLTLDDDTRTSMCPSPTPSCENPYATLAEPFAGTANGFNDLPIRLAAFNGLKMRGTWTMKVFDSVAMETSTFNSWSLEIKRAKPVVG